jgi:hypothetical protein
MVWFEILPSLVLTAGPLLLVAAPAVYIGNWYFLNGKVTSILFSFLISCFIQLEIWTQKYDER